MLCPMPVIKLARGIKDVEVGQVLKMIATDAGAPADVQAWSRQTGHALLKADEQGGKYIFFVRRVA